MSNYYTQEQLDFIRIARETMNARQIAQAYFERYGCKKHDQSINATCLRHGWKSKIDSKFKKGSTPWNAGTKGQGLTRANPGSFKKGNNPKNTRPIESERICHRDRYTYIKTAHPNTWKAKHIWLWEQQNGPVPKHHVLIFIDGDTSNISLENIELTSRNELLKYNENGLKTADTALKPVIKMISKIQVKLYEKQRNCNG